VCPRHGSYGIYVISNWLVIALMVSARIGHAGGVAVYGTVKLICKVVLKQPSKNTFA